MAVSSQLVKSDQTKSHTVNKRWCNCYTENNYDYVMLYLDHIRLLLLLVDFVELSYICAEFCFMLNPFCNIFLLVSESHWALNISLFRLHLLIWPSPFHLSSELTSGQPLSGCHARQSWHTHCLSLAQIRSCQPLFLQETSVHFGDDKRHKERWVFSSWTDGAEAEALLIL